MSNIKLDYFRLVLTENSQTSLLSQKTRTEIIEDFFSNDIDFASSKNTKYRYKFKSKCGNYILGLIFTKQDVEILEDPDNTEPCTHSNWVPEIVIINNGTIKGDNSQLFILQQSSRRKNDGSLTFLNNCLAKKLNQELDNKHSIYSASFSKVLEDNLSFWDYSSRDDIKELIIDYKMPNFLGIGDSTKNLNERLKHIKDQTNATLVRETIKNKDGNLVLKQDDGDLVETLELVKQGQSSIILKGIRQKIIYNSDKNEQIKSKEINIEGVEVFSSDINKSTKALNSILNQLGLNNESNT